MHCNVCQHVRTSCVTMIDKALEESGDATADEYESDNIGDSNARN